MLFDFLRVTPRSRNVKLRKKRGVLFRNPGVVGKISFYTGTVLFFLSVVYGFYLYLPLGTAIFKYWIYQRQQVAVTPVVPVLQPTPTVTVENSKEYSITVPKIMAYAKIVKDVSPFDPKIYLKILESNVVAQAKDTSEIGLGFGHTTYMFAHSSSEGLAMVRNNSVFYLLGELNNSDVIYVNRFGTIFTYQVYDQKIVNANQIEFLEYVDSEKEVLILQTCWPIGTDWKRLLVFAKRIK